MLKGVAPTAKGDCANPVADIVDFGKKRGITGTPTLIFQDGSRIPGALTAAQIESQLQGAGAK